MKLPIYLYGSEVLREPAAEADLDRKEELAGAGRKHGGDPSPELTDAVWRRLR